MREVNGWWHGRAIRAGVKTLAAAMATSSDAMDPWYSASLVHLDGRSWAELSAQEQQEAGRHQVRRLNQLSGVLFIGDCWGRADAWSSCLHAASRTFVPFRCICACARCRCCLAHCWPFFSARWRPSGMAPCRQQGIPRASRPMCSPAMQVAIVDVELDHKAKTVGSQALSRDQKLKGALHLAPWSGVHITQERFIVAADDLRLHAVPARLRAGTLSAPGDPARMHGAKRKSGRKYENETTFAQFDCGANRLFYTAKRHLAQWVEWNAARVLQGLLCTAEGQAVHEGGRADTATQVRAASCASHAAMGCK